MAILAHQGLQWITFNNGYVPFDGSIVYSMTNDERSVIVDELRTQSLMDEDIACMNFLIEKYGGEIDVAHLTQMLK